MKKILFGAMCLLSVACVQATPPTPLAKAMRIIAEETQKTWAYALDKSQSERDLLTNARLREKQNKNTDRAKKEAFAKVVARRRLEANL